MCGDVGVLAARAGPYDQREAGEQGRHAAAPAAAAANFTADPGHGCEHAQGAEGCRAGADGAEGVGLDLRVEGVAERAGEQDREPADARAEAPGNVDAEEGPER